ncbi:MAG: hypothetical protein JWO24_2952 [Rhodospirillales bacterium]|nr:hypothetical protein [Rhodospirillales bacterium]
MKTNYKVGDKVRLLSNGGFCRTSWTVGEIAEVTSGNRIYPDGPPAVFLKPIGRPKDGAGNLFWLDEVEPYVEPHTGPQPALLDVPRHPTR